MVSFGAGSDGKIPSPLEGLIGLLFSEKIDALGLSDEEKNALKAAAKK